VVRKVNLARTRRSRSTANQPASETV